MKAILSEKGQVTIPKRLRDRLGLRPGQVLDFTEERGKLVARKVVERDRIEELAGILDLEGKTTDAIMIELRGEPDGM